MNSEVTTINGEITSINGEIYELNQCCSDNRSDISTLNSEVTTINGEIYELNQCCSENKSDISTLNNDVTNINGEITGLQGQTYDLNQCCDENKSDIKTLNNDVTTINGDINTINGEIYDLNQCCDENIACCNEVKGDIADLQVKNYELNQCCEENKSEIITLNNDVTNINSEIKTINDELYECCDSDQSKCCAELKHKTDIMQAEIDANTECCNNLTYKTDTMQGEIDANTECCNNLEDKTDNIEQEIAELVYCCAKINDIQQQIDHLEYCCSEVQEVQSELTILQNRVDVLTQTINQMQGDIDQLQYCCSEIYAIKEEIAQIEAKLYECCKEGPFPPRPPSCNESCMRKNKLNLLKKYVHGAPVQSVAWLANDKCPWLLAAIGGYKSSIDGNTVRAYVLETNDTLEQPDAIDSIAPTDCVYAVDWCSIQDTTGNNLMYLAIGGVPNKDGDSIWIYRYIPGSTQGLEYVASYPYKGTVYSVSWLCFGYTDGKKRYLAIGGEPANGIDAMILQFDPDNAVYSLQSIQAIEHSSIVYSVSWCTKDPNNPLLALGGTTEYECKDKVNIRLYKFDCSQKLVPVCNEYYEGETVRSLKWCCESDPFGSSCLYLAVGGDPIINTKDPSKIGANIEVYVFNIRSCRLSLLAYQKHQEKIFSVGWVPRCNCSRVSSAGGCGDDGTCISKIFIDKIEKGALPLLVPQSSVIYDKIVTSSAWANINGCSYLLVGSEDKNWQQHFIDPLCPQTPHGCDFAMYKGIFCREKETHPPLPVCQRQMDDE